MDDTVQIKISADSAELQAALSRAEQALSSLQQRVTGTTSSLAPMDGATRELIDSWDRGASTLTRARDAFAGVEEALEANQISAQQAARVLQSIETAANSAGAGMEGFGHSTAGATREFIVLGHEAVSGNFSRIPGSLMVLLERMGGLSPVTLGWAAAIGVAGATAYELVSTWNQVAEAVRNAAGEMVIAGQYQGAPSDAGVRSGVKRLTQTFNAGSGEATKAEDTLRTLGGAAAQYTDRIRDAAAAEATLTSQDLDKTVSSIVSAFNGGAAGALRWAESNHILTTDQQAQIEVLVRAGAESEALGKILDAMQARFVNSGVAVAGANKDLRDFLTTATLLSGSDAGLSPDQFGIKLPSSEDLKPQPGTRAQNPAEADQDATVLRVNKALQDQLVIYQEIAEVQAAQDRGAAGAADAQASLWRQLGQVHTDSEKEAHEQTLGVLQQELAAARDNATQRVALLQQIAAETVRYNGANTDAARQAQNAVVQAEQQAADKRLQVELLVLSGKQVAAREDLAQQVAIQDQKIALLEQSGRQGTSEYQEALNQRTELERKQADQAFEVAVEQLRQQQTAYKDDYDFQLQIEDQILETYKQHYGENTKEFQAELLKRQELLRDDAAQQQRIREVIDAGQADRAKLSQRQDTRQRTNYGLFGLVGGDASQDLAGQQAQLKADFDQQQSALMQSLSTAMNPVDFNKIFEQLETSQAQFAQRSEQLNQQAAQSVSRSWQTILSPISRGFSSAFTGILTGTLSVQQGVQRVCQSIVESFINAAAQSAEKWAAAELTKLTMTETTQAGATAAIAANQAAQTGIREAGNTAQAASDSKSVLNSAYKAAAATYASVADIPVVGPFLAPAAAAAAFAAVAAFDVISAAGGMGDVPFDDMPALLHRNEMVLPASIATPLRSAIDGGSLGGGDSSSAASSGDVHLHAHVTVNGGNPDDVSGAVMGTLEHVARHGVPAKYPNLQRVMRKK